MESQLKQVFMFYRPTGSSPNPPESHKANEFLDVCFGLFERDYEVDVISNQEPLLCPTYPEKIFFPTKEKFRVHQNSQGHESRHEWKEIGQHIESCKDARVRSRFPVPVIMWRQKLVCRSSTLSRGAEMVFRGPKEKTKELFADVYGYCFDQETDPLGFIDKMRTLDIQLLNHMNVSHICDLMVEDKKSYYGLSVCSSEKADNRGRYKQAQFKLSAIPYPGVEFFSKFKENQYDVRDLFFDWQAAGADAQINVACTGDHSTIWETYRGWDIVKLTQKYVQYILQCLVDGEDKSGVLIHCISGWDRTPLFVSLVRILLWAEGECHPSLSSDELLYLTLTYDWFLFCHQFAVRFAKGEEIMFFCFRILRELLSDEFSLRWQVEHLQKWAEQNHGANREAPSEDSMNSPIESAKMPTSFSTEYVHSSMEETETIDSPRESDDNINTSPLQNPCHSITSAIHSSCTDHMLIPSKQANEDEKHTSEGSFGSWEMVGQYLNKYRTQFQSTRISSPSSSTPDTQRTEPSHDRSIQLEATTETTAATTTKQKEFLSIRPETVALFSSETLTERSERMQRRRERLEAVSHRFEAMYGEFILGQEQPRASWNVLSWLHYN